jgi:hypothetical protein
MQVETTIGIVMPWRAFLRHVITGLAACADDDWGWIDVNPEPQSTTVDDADDAAIRVMFDGIVAQLKTN